ncbi:MAG TPA: hypothetical protein VK186_12470 [Candidatus Deferrimicrobium sp.]|nr:hypothetical protein [Candidatus Kapabacteria bacterium]HLP59644.1 hypothetical protein [Candidatus Deferrimicrobium sp.]
MDQLEQKIYEVEMMYIQNTSGQNYSVEVAGKRCKAMKLNFSNVEGVEFSPQRAVELKNSYLQMAEGQNKMWSLKFAYPTNLSFKYAMNKIVIDLT